MKFTQKDFKNLLDCIETAGIDLKESREHYIKNNIGNDPEKRFVWDVFWTSKYSRIHREDSEKYADNHIETATKKAIKTLIQLETNKLA